MAPSKDPNRLFPSMLHRMMEESEEKNFNDCISWVQIDGYCHAFKVHNKTKFEKEVLPLYFKTAYYKSFQRLVLYCLFFSSFLQEHPELLLLFSKLNLEGASAQSLWSLSFVHSNARFSCLTLFLLR